MIFHDVQQNTEAWDNLRIGRITSSSLSKIMANFGKPFGDPAKKYAVEIAVGQITGESIASSYSNDHMERGHEDEPIARMLYEDKYFCAVVNGGFFEDGDIGCSPDGVVGDGLIEIKSAIPSIHYSRIVRQSYDPAYKWQLIGNMKFTQKKWIDFVSYCKAFPEDGRLYVYRCNADEFKEEFSMIDERIDGFRKLIDEARDKILNSNYSLLTRKDNG